MPVAELTDSPPVAELDDKPPVAQLTSVPPNTNPNPRPLAGRIADFASKVIGNPSGLGIAGWTDALSHPVSTLAKVPPETFQKQLINIPKSSVPKGSGIIPSIGAGVSDFVSSLVEGLSTPENIGLLASGGLGEKAAQAVSAKFLGQMAANAPEQAAEVGKKLGEGDKAGATSALLNYAMGTLLPAAAVHPAVASATAKLPIAREEAIKTGVEDASEISKSKSLSVQPLRQEVGAQAPLRQQGKAAEARQEAKAAAPQIKQAQEQTPLPLPGVHKTSTGQSSFAYELKPEHKAALDEAVKSSDIPVEYHEPADPNEPFAGLIAQPNRAKGTIVINPKELSAWLDTEVPKGKEAEAIRSLLSEESIHSRVTDEQALAYHDTLTAAEKALGRRIYGQFGKELSPTMLGHEMLRMRLQQLARIDVRETLQRSLRERWSVKSMLALNDAIRGIRESLGTDASKEGLAILDKVQENLNAALRKSVPQGTEPPAQRRKQDKTQEFFLPPMEESGGARPSAIELGASQRPAASITADDIDWKTPDAFKLVDPELLNKPYSLGRYLTKGARVAGSKTATESKAVVALEKNGKVDVVHIYQDPDDLAMVQRPTAIGQRVHSSIRDILADGYKPLGGYLLKEPTEKFHQHFNSVEDYQRQFGTPAEEQATKVQTYEPPETAYEDRGEGDAAQKVPVVQPAEHELTAYLNRDESNAIKTHFSASKTPLEAVESFKTTQNKDLLKSALLKAMQSVQQRLPSITPEEAWDRAFKELYESAQSAKTNEDFHRAALERFGGAGGKEPGGLQGSNAPGARRRRLPEAVQDEIDLTKSDLSRFVSGKKALDQVSRTWAGVSNNPHRLAQQAENAIRFASIRERPKGLAAKLSDWTRGDKDVLAAANAVVQLGGIRRDGTLDPAAKGNIPAARELVEKGTQRAMEFIRTGLWDGVKPEGSQIVAKIRARRIIASNKQLLKELDYAEKNWNDPVLQRTAKYASQHMEEEIKAEHLAGYPVEREANYDPQRYIDSGDARSILFGGDTLRLIGKRFRLGRRYHSYYEAAADGFIPATRDIASLVSHRVRQGQSMIARGLWQESLPAVTMGDGRPLAVQSVQAKGRYSKEYAAPEGYADYKIIPGLKNELAIHPDAVSLIDNLIAPSKVKNWPITRNALKFSQGLKHSLLAGDFFHFGRVTGYGLSIMGKKAQFRSALGAMDIAERDLPRAVELGVLTPKEAAWGLEKIQYGKQQITRRAAIDKFYTEMGANLGMIQDALYKELITNVTPGAGKIAKGLHAVVDPSFGRYQRFLFDKYTRGIMGAANIAEFERQMKANLKVDPNALMRDIATDVNNYFGNIGQQGWIKSRTMQDLSRMLWLAPSWEEGLIKKEVSFYGRASGLSSLTGQRAGLTTLGTTGRGIGRGLLFMMGLTQAINLISRGKPTWQNEEPDHKWSAFVPNWDGTPGGFWFDPTAFFNETTHDMYRLMEGNKTFMQAADQVFGNKEAPLTRAAILSVVGTDQSGQRFSTSGGQLKSAASKLAPTPITFGKYGQALGHSIAPGTIPPVPPGQIQRQTMASVGFKLQPKLTPSQDIADRATKFVRENHLKPESGWEEVQTDEPSYTKLRSALRVGDQKEAAKQFAAIRNDHTDKQIYHAMKLWSSRPFTGRPRAERQFISSLDDHGLETYFAAVNERQQLYQRFLDFVFTQP